MVERLLTLGKNGVSDWLIQRISALIIAAYALCIMGFTLTNAPLTYQVWQDFFSHPWMQYFSFFAILSIVSHAWVGLWTVFTDYIKCSCGRLVLQTALVLFLVGLVIWGAQIIWRF